MNKEEFLNGLQSQLKGLNEEDRQNRVSFYREMIEDRVDEGMSEEEAIEELGGLDKVINDIIQETPLLSLVKEKVKPKHSLRAWEIVMLILGFPLWFPLLLVFVILCFLPYIILWVLVLVTYAIEATFIVGIFVGIGAFILSCIDGAPQIAFLGAAILMVGLSIFFFYACIGVTKGICKLSKVTGRRIKSMFIKKEK